jgi:Alpha/beta hydrolase domain
VASIYEFVYEANDPTVMGLGHAATRDFLSFLKYEVEDDFGNPNPVAEFGGVSTIYSWGRSQGGRVERDFLYYGFNEDESGRQVIDGMMPYATGAAGRMWMNFRFAQPTVSAQQHSRHHSHEPEFPHTFPVMTDPFTQQEDGILRRCLESDTCPKFFNIDGANEYWNKTSSLNHTDAFGNDLDIDELAPNVRIYSIAGIEHNTVFDERPTPLEDCQQLTNPLYNGPIFRALAVALDRWVTHGILPPPSRVPKRSDGTLVVPEAVNFPAIPATAYEGWPDLPEVEYHPESMNHNVVLDFSVVPPEHIDDLQYTVQVAQVDEDGNELAGIRLPYLTAPLGTHTGWNLFPPGMGGPDLCGQDGSFIPFADTRAERLAASDPRLSLEERYPTHGSYVSKVARAADRLVREGFLLKEDKDQIVEAAADTGPLFGRQPRDRSRIERSATTRRKGCPAPVRSL